MYLFFYPWANIGFITFRCTNIVLGALVPCLVYLLSTRFRVNSYLASAVAAIISFHPVCVFFSTIVFPDTLATVLILSSYLAFFSRKLKTATLLFCVTVLTKEAFAMFLIPILAIGAVEFLRKRSWSILSPIAAVCTVACTNGASLYLLGGRLQGWSTAQADPNFFAQFLASPWFLSFLAVLIFHKEFEAFAISLGAPLFFAVWSGVLHKGVDGWYILGPLPVALVSTSVALMRTFEVLSRFGIDSRRSHHIWKNFTTVCSRCAAAVCLFALATSPDTSGWQSLRSERTFEMLSRPRPLPKSGTIEQVVTFLKSHDRPKTLLAIDLFWAFAFYPLGRTAERVDKWYPNGSNDERETSILAQMLSEHDCVIWGKYQSVQAVRFETAILPCLVFKNDDYKVYRITSKCQPSLAKYF
jgi:hypothetical protein